MRMAGADGSQGTALDAGKIITGADVKFYDTKNQEVDSQKVTLNDVVSLNYTWAIPDDIAQTLKAGDYITFKLPDDITAAAQTGQLDDVGDYKVIDDGTVTLTFNQNAVNMSDVKGTFTYNVGTLKNKTVGNHNLVIPIKDHKDVTVPITLLPNNQYDISKVGKSIDGGLKQEWTISLNNTGKEMENPYIQEELPSGIKLDSVAVHEGIVATDGTESNGQELKEGTDYQLDGNNIKFIGAYAKTNKPLNVTYTTVLTDPSKAEENVTFTNKATLKYGGENQPKTPPSNSYNVTINYKPHQMLEKKLVGDAFGENDYSWQITYNPYGQTIKAGTTLTDKLDDKQSYIKSGQTDGGIIVAEAGYGGNDVLYGGTHLTSGTDYTIDYSDDGKQFTLTFNKDIESPIFINYNTHVDGNMPDSGVEIKNTVEENPGKPITAIGTAKPHRDKIDTGLEKNYGNADAKNKTVDWRIDVNKNNQQTLTDYWVQDDLPAGLTFVDGSLTVYDVTTKQNLDAGAYTFAKNDKGFKVTFKDDVKDHYQIKYTTKYDESKDITNKVGDSYDNHKEKHFTPPSGQDTKYGNYSPQTNLLTWTIIINTDNKELATGAEVTDPINSDQQYVPGSYRVYKLNKSGESKYNTDYNSIINGNAGELIDAKAEGFKFTEPTDSNPTLKVDLPVGLTDAYAIIFDIKPMDLAESHGYDNTAYFHNGDEDKIIPANQYWFATGGKLINKSGVVNIDDKSKVDWTVDINVAQAEMSNVVITDTASANQVVDLSTLKVQQLYHDTWNDDKVYLPQEGDVGKDSTILQLGVDYDVTSSVDQATGQTETKLTFKHDIDKTYRVTYQSTINSSTPKDTLINDVNITGYTDKVITGNSTAKTDVVTSSGTGDGVNGSLQVIKEDTDNKKRLEYAEFSLLQGSKVIRTGTTDANGQITWGGLKNGNYILREDEAPKGYEINPDYANGKTISVANTEKQPQTSETVDDPKANAAIRLTKKDAASGAPLAGAEFDLYNANNELVEQNLKTDKDGQILVKNLATGDYYFKEVKAPSGYDVNNNPDTEKISVTSENDESNPAEVTVKNKVKPILPFTGGSGRLAFIVLGLIATGIGAIALHLRKTRGVM